MILLGVRRAHLPGQQEPALPMAEQNNYQGVEHTTFGPSFWKLTENFPNATFMVQVPMATTNISETIAWAQSAIEAIGMENIHSIQPGNEANLYTDTDTYNGEGGIELSSSMRSATRSSAPDARLDSALWPSPRKSGSITAEASAGTCAGT
ncbi:hypothetical protein F5X99DRAFT_378939 [Biscogniauxia marginata]|nr:hypothetical protein F5X99DRAFT_378939 [Biscogniauxia marginata]